MRNAVQQKIKNLEETQLQKLDSSRVESSTVCMTLTQLPGPVSKVPYVAAPFRPVPSSFEFTTHSRAQRSPGVPHEVLRRIMYMYIFPPTRAFAVCTLCQKQSFRKFSTYVNLSCKMLVL